MKKCLFFFLLNFVFITLSFGQTQIEQEKAIAIVEDIYYDEFYMEDKCYFKIDIAYAKNENSFEIEQSSFFGKDDFSKSSITFSKANLDLASMKYDLYEIEPNKYFVTVRLEAQEKAVTVNSEKTDKTKSVTPIKTVEQLDFLKLAPVAKSLPKDEAMSFVENIKIFLGVESYTRATLFKF